MHQQSGTQCWIIAEVCLGLRSYAVPILPSVDTLSCGVDLIESRLANSGYQHVAKSLYVTATLISPFPQP